MIHAHYHASWSIVLLSKEESVFDNEMSLTPLKTQCKVQTQHAKVQ